MANMGIVELMDKAYMLLGTDCRKWRTSDIPLVAQMVVDDDPSFCYNVIERADAVLSVKCRLYDAHRNDYLTRRS